MTKRKTMQVGHSVYRELQPTREGGMYSEPEYGYGDLVEALRSVQEIAPVSASVRWGRHGISISWNEDEPEAAS